MNSNEHKESAGTASLKARLAEEVKDPAPGNSPKDVKLTVENPVFHASSSSMVEGGTEGNPGVPGDKMAETSDVKVPEAVDVKNDPLISRADKSDGIGRVLSGADPEKGTQRDDPSKPLFLNEAASVKITPADKSAFITAIATGERYERPFSLFAGLVRGRLRCKSFKESDGIAGWLNLGTRAGKFKTPLDYSNTVRNALFTAQVAELQGTEFPLMKTPYGPTPGRDIAKWSDVQEPGWLEDAARWNELPEAIITALYAELKTFEQKYWTMAHHAADQNFWNPATSS
jgi:hypothetical protein